MREGQIFGDRGVYVGVIYLIGYIIAITLRLSPVYHVRVYTFIGDPGPASRPVIRNLPYRVTPGSLPW